MLSPNIATLWYKAPEVFYGNYNYTSKVDIWAVGCILGEFFIREPQFKGNCIVSQIKAFYEILGNPDENWAEVKEYKNWEEMKPRKTYKKKLEKFIQNKNPDIDKNGIDQLERQLTYNCDLRISAETALAHPWFQTEPLACEPKEIQRFDVDFHDTLIADLKHREEVKKLIRKQELLKNNKESVDKGKIRVDVTSTKSENQIQKNKTNRLRMQFNANNTNYKYMNKD